MKTALIITIDGPAGAGKSSASRLLAERLGYQYVDTGALYRAVGLLAWERGVPPDDSAGLAALCESLSLRFITTTQGIRLYVDDRDVTVDIRRPEVSQMASQVSTNGAVRQYLLAVQRALGKDGGVVVEGRDIGTVVFPDADVKVYLDAALEERGRRRHAELQQQGVQTTLTATIQDLRERDRRDTNRTRAPLRPADDAVVVDTTSLSRAEVIDTLMTVIQAHASGDGRKGKLKP